MEVPPRRGTTLLGLGQLDSQGLRQPSSTSPESRVASGPKAGTGPEGSRLVVGNDGREHVEADLLTIRDHAPEPEMLLQRYEAPRGKCRKDAEDEAHGRMINLEPVRLEDRPMLLSEFGGIHYPQASTAGATTKPRLWARPPYVTATPARGLPGFCYIHFADTLQEQNGSVHADRAPKALIEDLAATTRAVRRSCHEQPPQRQ